MYLIAASLLICKMGIMPADLIPFKNDPSIQRIIYKPPVCAPEISDILEEILNLQNVWTEPENRKRCCNCAGWPQSITIHPKCETTVYC